jgi:hypothetical protein
VIVRLRNTMRPIFAAAFLCLDTASAASMNVHTLVGERASAYFAGVTAGEGISPTMAAALQAVIRNNTDAISGGADFPDFLYACGTYADHHDAGEAAHWPPFQAAGIRYVRERWPDPALWDDDAKELIAFIFGVSVHYVADELWEGLASPLGERRGFTEMIDVFQLGNVGHGNVAEGVSNWGGDLYASWTLDEGNISAWTRKFPLEELVEIYHMTPKNGVFAHNSTNFTDVTLASLVECKGLFDIGLWALQTFGTLLYPFYNDGPMAQHKLPYIQENLLEAPLVGLDDMGAVVTFAWGRLARWLASPDGPPLVPPQRSDLDKWAAAAAGDADDRSWYELSQRLVPFVTHTSALRGLPQHAVREYFRVVAEEKQRVGLSYDGPVDLEEPLWGIVQALADHFLSASRQATATDAGATPIEFYRVPPSPPATPGASALSALPATSVASATHADPVAWSIRSAASGSTGVAALAYHGSAVASGDFDGDGQPEAAVGAMGVGSQGGAPRSGVVFVDQPGVSASSSASRVVLDGGASPMARFGSTLVVLDWNLDGIDDLAVGAPGWSGWNTSDAAASPFPLNGDPTYRNYGRVFVYLGSKGSGLQVAAPIVLTTSNVFTGLGWALAAADVTSDGHSDLLLGCPQANDWDGRVLALAATTARVAGAVLDVDAPGVADLDLSGKASAAEFGAGWFGASVAVSAGDAPSAPPLLLVGAPYSRHNLRCSQECEIVGRVFGFALASQDAALPKPFNTSAAIFSIFGEDPLGRMGASVATTMAGASGGVAGGELVALGVPGAGATRMGKIALINAASLPSLRGDVSLASLEPTTARMLLGDVEQGRLGSTLIFADVTADGQPDLITSAPHENGKSGLHIPFDQRELGSVYVFDRAELLCWSRHWLTSSASTNNATWAHKGTRARGRLGASVAALNQSCMLVGSPRASAESPYIMEGNGAVDILCVH